MVKTEQLVAVFTADELFWDPDGTTDADILALMRDISPDTRDAAELARDDGT